MQNGQNTIKFEKPHIAPTAIVAHAFHMKNTSSACISPEESENELTRSRTSS